MGKCIICGKHGLFLKVDNQKRCIDCANKIEQEEQNKFEFYYQNLLCCLKDIQESIAIGKEPIIALEFIPSIESKLEKCEILHTEIHRTEYEERLANRIRESITYRDDFNKRYGIGDLKEWDISIFADTSSKEFTTEVILSSIDKQIVLYRQKWTKTIKSIQNSAEFQRQINAIPSAEITVTDTKHNKQRVSELNDLIKFTNITPKTNFDRIGSFVVVDTETTGLSSTKDDIIEVAAIRFEDWTPVEKFQTLINPGKHIPNAASEVNSITDEMVANAPSFAQIIDCLDVFIGKSNIIGHNLLFDLKFLYRHGYNFTTKKRHYYDTCEIAQKTLKKPKMKWDKEFEEYVINDNYDYDVEDHKLTTLCDYYGIRDNTFAHRALSDALAAGILYKKLAQDKTNR